MYKAILILLLVTTTAYADDSGEVIEPSSFIALFEVASEHGDGNLKDAFFNEDVILVEELEQPSTEDGGESASSDTLCRNWRQLDIGSI